MNNVEKMIALLYPRKEREYDPPDVVSVEGFIVERMTGRVVRCDLTLDQANERSRCCWATL